MHHHLNETHEAYSRAVDHRKWVEKEGHQGIHELNLNVKAVSEDKLAGGAIIVEDVKMAEGINIS